MQLLTTTEQMQEFDRTAIARYRIPGLLLMENAGRAFVSELEARCAPLVSKHVVVVCGKGNNGGDGFVIARHLVNRGCRVDVVLLGKGREVRGDALTNLQSVLKLAGAKKGLEFRFAEVVSGGGFKGRSRPDIVVDAIFGTGFAGRVEGTQKEATDWINGTGAFTASVDIASGVHASTGHVEGEAVSANLTVTMAAAKIGQYIGAGRDHSGEVVVVDIGIPHFLLRPSRQQAYRVGAPDLALPARPLSAHKYSVGKVFVVAGSRDFSGAPLMCAQAALRSGAGAVILGVPRCLQETMARKLTEVIVAPLDETGDGTVAASAFEQIREKSQWADVVVVGPGLSRNEETDALVRKTLAAVEKPLVLDADGLNAVAGGTAILKNRKGDTIITPHAGELSRLTGGNSREIDEYRIDAARKAARLFRSIVLLKGAPTVTSDPEGVVFVNSTGNPGMATIGSGDVLTGLIAGLLAQGMSATASAWGGAYLHGKAGDLAAARLGQRSLLALDILTHVPDAIRSVER